MYHLIFTLRSNSVNGFKQFLNNMYFTEIVNFNDTCPDISKLLSTVATITGLEVTYNYQDFVIEEIGTDNYAVLLINPMSYSLERLTIDMSYIFASTIYSLILLGGQYNKALPSWAGQKWETVKNNFDENYFLKNV